MLTRRGFLARGAAGLAAAGSGPLLAACAQQAGAASGVPVPPIPGPARPIRWPLSAANPPLASGLRPERGATLRLLTAPGYVSTRCLGRFARLYRCQVELTETSSSGAMRAALASRRAGYDVVLGVPIDALRLLLKARLLRPLTHGYLPNLADVWLNLTSPFYDEGSRYSVPYTARSTGIAWRADLVREDPGELTNGWLFLWQRAFRGRVGILDDYRESLSLGLLSGGNTDLSTADPRLLDTAAAALASLARLTRMSIGNAAAARLAAGQSWIHHAWSGDALAAARMLPAGAGPGALAYWVPEDDLGPVASDTMVLPRQGRNPVLGHLLLNYLLDRRNAVINFAATGYVQPLRSLTPERLIRLGLVPPHLAVAVAQPDALRNGLRELPLPGPADELWQQVWRGVLAAGRAA